MEDFKELKTDSTVIEKIATPSSKRNRFWGKLKTFGSVACGLVIGLGVVTNPIGIALLGAAGLVLGGDAFRHALVMGDGFKTKK